MNHYINKYEKKYMLEFEIPELEKRKKVLEELRNYPLYTKTDYENIRKHSMEYEKIKKQKLDLRIKSRMETIKVHHQYDPKKFKTKTFERLAMREDLEKNMEEEKKNERMKLINQTKHYAKNVIDLHKPKISVKKQEEMRKMVEETTKPPKQKVNKIRYERSVNSILNNPMKRAREVRGNSEISSLSKMDSSLESPKIEDRHDFKGSNSTQYDDGLEMVPEQVAKYESTLNPPRDYKSPDRSKTTIRRAAKRRLNNLSMNNSQDYQPKPFIKYDYLAEMRNKKIEDGGYDYKEKDFWASDIKDPNKSSLDMYHQIKFKTRDLERKAKVKENQMQGDNGNLKYSEEVSSMYLDAIKAKAALLSNL